VRWRSPGDVKLAARVPLGVEGGLLHRGPELGAHVQGPLLPVAPVPIWPPHKTKKIFQEARDHAIS
jgi:hypothetical protein